MSAIKSVAPPTPMAGKNQPVDWMFAFKFNGASFPGCAADGSSPAVGTPGIFGGTVQHYPLGKSQQYVFATSASPALVKGAGCLGATLTDPLGATFAQLYNTAGLFYVVWNDQFYNLPLPNLESPWGHSKGLVAWNADGAGMVLQVSTPSWPASGSKAHPRDSGDTLGTVTDDDIMFSQHFFALKLTPADVIAVLQAIDNASVVTDVSQPSLVQNGGPPAIHTLVSRLGIPKTSRGRTDPPPPALPTPPVCTRAALSSGVQLISKPAALALPPWQLVSARLGGRPLRVASWWEPPCIYSTPAGVAIEGWQASLGSPGAVEIATSGAWDGTSFKLTAGQTDQYNHAKIGISTDRAHPTCIFGDMNQQGALSSGYAYPTQKMTSSQNGRGGTFYALDDPQLHASLAKLLGGDTAPASGPNGESSSSGAPATTTTPAAAAPKPAAPKPHERPAAPKPRRR